MSTYSGLRDLILAQIAVVPDSGRVHRFWPLVTNAEGVVNFYQTQIDNENVLLFWAVLFQGLQTNLSLADFGELNLTAQFVAHGYRAVRDPEVSETAFYDLAETVYESVANGAYHSVTGIAHGMAPPTMVLDHRMVSSVLYHHAAITLAIPANLTDYTGS